MTDAKSSLDAVRQVELKIESDPQALRSVRERTSAIAKAIGFDEEATGGIVLAVDEALANVIRHAYRGEPGHPIDISAAATEKDGRSGIEIIIRDYGPPVDLKSIQGRDLREIRPGGLGMHIILSVMESAEYSKAEGGGTTLKMLKFLPLAVGSKQGNKPADA